MLGVYTGISHGERIPPNTPRGIVSPCSPAYPSGSFSAELRLDTYVTLCYIIIFFYREKGEKERRTVSICPHGELGELTGGTGNTGNPPP